MVLALGTIQPVIPLEKMEVDVAKEIWRKQ